MWKDYESMNWLFLGIGDKKKEEWAQQGTNAGMQDTFTCNVPFF